MQYGLDANSSNMSKESIEKMARLFIVASEISRRTGEKYLMEFLEKPEVNAVLQTMQKDFQNPESAMYKMKMENRRVKGLSTKAEEIQLRKEVSDPDILKSAEESYQESETKDVIEETNKGKDKSKSLLDVIRDKIKGKETKEFEQEQQKGQEAQETR